MTWWVTLAFAGRWLVGVEHGPVDLDRDGDGRVDGSDVAYVCYRSSRVCVMSDTLPAASLRQRDGVRYVEADRPAQQLQGAALTPCPPSVAADELGYELERIGVSSGALGGAWAEGRGAGAVVAVQDAGFRTSHDDLVGRIVRGWDYGDNDGRPEVSPALVPEHGTFVAGMVAANEDGAGRVGVAPEAELFLQKVADRYGALYFSYAIAAMDDLVATAPDVRVVDYSIASVAPPRAFEDAVAGLASADILLVTAAANCTSPSCATADNDVNPVFPANYALTMDHVLAVSSQRPDGSLDPFSHFGATSVAVGAPGADVCSLDVANDSAYTRASGTSYAAPVVAGVAALVRQAFPRLTADQTEAHLCATADETELVGLVRCGAVDADRALHAAWPEAVTGDGLAYDDAALVTGQPTAVALEIDNLAGAEDVTVSLEGAGIGATSVTVALLPDGLTPVVLDVVADDVGPVSGEITVSGCCASLIVPWSGLATEALETGDTGFGSGTPSTADTAEAPDTGAPPTGSPEPAVDSGAQDPPPRVTQDASGCGCATGGWPARLSAPLRRRRAAPSLVSPASGSPARAPAAGPRGR